MPHGPTPVVEISFDDGPYVASPTWVDITSYVRDITIHRGRSSDFDQFDTGTAQLVLDNRTRLFDPLYTSGTYYGKLLPRRQIRIRGTANSTTYDVFRGYIAGWPVTWSEAGYDSTVTIQAFDALGLMANETLPTDWPQYTTEALNPRHYWKFNDTRTSKKVVDRGSGPNLTIDYSAASEYQSFETPPMADGCVGNSLFLTTNTGASITTTTAFQNFTIAGLFLNPNNRSSSSAGYFIFQYNGVALYVDIYDQITNPRIRIIQGGTVYEYAGPALPKTNATYLTFTINAATPGTVIIGTFYNGTLVTSTFVSSAAAAQPNKESFTVSDLQCQEVTVYDGILSDANIAKLYNAITGRYSETTTARMNRLIGTTSYPAALQNFTASPVATVSEIGSGAGVIAEMQLVADSEGGEIYVAKDGKLTTTARFDVFNATRSANVQATITDSGAGLKYGPELLIEYDADNLKNDITLQFSGDGEVNVSSDYTITTYGGASTTVETQLDSPTSATELANMELGVEGVLIPRISPLDLTPNTAAADWATILGLELLDRVTFKRTPATGNQFSRDALINAIDHQITPGVWQTQVTLSMRYTSPETLDDDVLGLLDLNYLG